MFQSFEDTGGPVAVPERVKALRALMPSLKVDAVLVPRADEHQGEYVPPCAERLKWLTGFSGSAGMAIVTKKAAGLFIDGRYTVQAAAETETSVFEVSLLPRAKISEWIAEKLTKGQTLGFDPWLHNGAEIERLTKSLDAQGISLKALSKNPIDHIWGTARPDASNGPIAIQPTTLSGKSSADKIAVLQKRLRDDGHHAAVLTLPDSICWLFNIRGRDIAHNPVVLAFAIVPATGKPELFVAPEKLKSETRKYLAEFAKLSSPRVLMEKLATLKQAGKPVRVDHNTASYAIEKALGAKVTVHGSDPCIALKSIKTAAEIAGTRAAHIRDGAAVVSFLAWLDTKAATFGLDEITAVRALEDFRSATGALMDVSFPTISGSGPNGAIVHYRVTDKTNRRLQEGELFLIDSGGQYQDGTTDITRTVAIGTPSEEMRQRFTAVLKGHIALATARFPKGTRGLDLDPFARRPLWDMGADFDHGTGHGIGSYLSVHEGPQSISRGGNSVLEPGMLLSNEPGFYKEGAFGIRIENVVLVTALKKVAGGGDREMMAFETLTLAPIDRRLVVASRLSRSEREWLNAYHARVYVTLSPILDEAVRYWLAAATAAI